MPYNVTALAAEITNDPLARGYAGMTDQQVADSLLIKNRSRNRTSMTRQEIYENIAGAALAALSAVELAQLNLAMSDEVNPFGNAQQVFINIFGGGSATVTALAAARVETVSRAEEIDFLVLDPVSLAGFVTEIRSAP